MNLTTEQRIVLKTRMELSKKTFPGAQYKLHVPNGFLKYPWLQLQCHQIEFKSPCKDPNTAALGQMTDVMMQLNEVETPRQPQSSWS